MPVTRFIVGVVLTKCFFAEVSALLCNTCMVKLEYSL